ncbi:MAG: Crp/Fnr family transcriptional regulator [Clostridia bacterium]|nr:Crp/Fnr family transcriptional regulator [Clostridia bacterium]
MYNINNLFLFNGLKSEEITSIVSMLPPPVKVKKDEVIFSCGSFEKAVGVILSGKAVARSDKVIKNTFSEGSVFGAAAVYGAEEIYVSDIIAKSDCTVQFIPEDILKFAVAGYPACAENYITFLSDKIRYLNKRIKQYTGNTASSKLYRYLCDNAGEDKCVDIKNMSALAALTGMGRTSLYRALGELEKNGEISRENGKIKVR